MYLHRLRSALQGLQMNTSTPPCLTARHNNVISIGAFKALQQLHSLSVAPSAGLATTPALVSAIGWRFCHCNVLCLCLNALWWAEPHTSPILKCSSTKHRNLAIGKDQKGLGAGSMCVCWEVGRSLKEEYSALLITYEVLTLSLSLYECITRFYRCAFFNCSQASKFTPDVHATGLSHSVQWA